MIEINCPELFVPACKLDMIVSSEISKYARCISKDKSTGHIALSTYVALHSKEILRIIGAI